MLAESAEAKQGAPIVVQSEECLDFASIYDNNVGVVVWHRPEQPSLTASAKALINTPGFPPLTGLYQPDKAVDALSLALPSFAGKDALVADLALQIDIFCTLFELDQTALRLTKLSQAMCPRFHVDRVPCRLVTTYVGQGSEWLAHDRVDRSKLGHGCGGLDDENSGLYDTQNPVSQAETQDVVLLKGEHWQNNIGRGAVHRSPALKVGEYRLLLTLDFA
jgi:hypothetical protein